MDYGYLNAIRLLSIFGEVENEGTSTGGMEKPPLRNNALFTPLLWTGKWCETSKRPRITKSAQEPGLSCKVADCPLTSANHLSRLEEEGWPDGQAEGLGGFEVDDQLRYDRASCRPQSTAPRMLGSHSPILRSHHQPAVTTFLEHPQTIPMDGRPARHEQRHGAANLDLRGAHRPQLDI